MQAFACSETGATAIEYGLIVAGLAVAISAVVLALGTSIAGKFSDAVTYLSK